MSFLRNLLGRKPMTLEEDPYGYSRYKYEVRFSLIGTVRSGKSTLAAALVVAAETMSAMMKGFYCRVLPKSSHIMTDANNLRCGRFPAKTDPFLPIAPEAGLLIGQSARRPLGKDTVTQVPICDVGGEVMDALAIVRPTQRQLEYIRNINRQVVNHIQDSQGFIIVLPATDALFFRKDHIVLDSDSYLYNILGQMMDYKRDNKGKIKGVAVWFTKWDEAMVDAKELGMDIYHSDEAVTRFMDNGFPGLAMLLKGLRDEGRVRYFRSYFNPARHDDGRPVEWSDGSPKIKLIDDPRHYIRFKPDFAGDEYVEFIKWAASFAK